MIRTNERGQRTVILHHPDRRAIAYQIPTLDSVKRLITRFRDEGSGWAVDQLLDAYAAIRDLEKLDTTTHETDWGTL